MAEQIQAPFNFGALEEEYSGFDKAKIVVLPVPYEMTSTWIKGSEKGPDAIIDASRNMELYDIETNSEVYRMGIHTHGKICANAPEQMIGLVQGRVGECLKREKFVVTLGGEHTVAIGAIKAYRVKYSELSILHLDAHTDLRDSYEGSRFSHACAMARVKEELAGGGNVVSAGIRSMDVSELDGLDRDMIFTAEEIHASRSNVWLRRVINKLGQNVYVDIDLDVFDPGIMPSTGTPEPGGLDWYQVLELLQMVARERNIVGMDVVELCPFEYNRAPDFLAAKLIYKILSYRFCKHLLSDREKNK